MNNSKKLIAGNIKTRSLCKIKWNDQKKNRILLMRELGNFYGTKESYQILMAPRELTLVAFVLHF